mmetsp:Transcript_42784/g.85742  ORF Transcript_42784/g.85742 Transcript_42784/m.85742 type:complete len:112 (+) Transcript_42784:406-741(+)
MRNPCSASAMEFPRCFEFVLLTNCGLTLVQELQRLLEDEGLSHAVKPLENAGVKTVEDLAKLAVWQIDELDLPLASKRKLKVQADKLQAQQTFVDAVRPKLSEAAEPAASK